MWGRAFLETPGGGWSGGGLAGQTGGVLGLGRVRWALGLGLGPRSWAALVLLPAVRQHQGQGPCPHMWVVSLFPCWLAGPLPWPSLGGRGLFLSRVDLRYIHPSPSVIHKKY